MAVSERFKSEAYFALIYEVESAPVGYQAIVNYEKIDHMFVLPKYRNKSIAKSLWSKVEQIFRTHSRRDYFGVRSSSYALPVYQPFVFSVSGDRQENNGISFQFLEKEMRDER